MAVDLTGGMDPSVDEITVERPASSTFREGVATFVWDDAGRFSFPRIMAEAVGATWETSRRSMLYYAQPGGRLLTVTADEPPHSAFDEHGQPRVLGGGPLRFTCLEPFTHWQVTFDGTVTETHVQELIAGHRPGDSTSRHATGQHTTDTDAKRLPLYLDVNAWMAAPPWVQGSLEPEGYFTPGENRFEQLFTATGTVTIDGETTSFTGGGLRIHRRGGNRGSGVDFYGHVWQTARFPSGRAFGFMHYRPRPDGSQRYREGWLMDDDGQILPARAVQTPWMTDIQPEGEDVSFTLRTPKGDVRIEAETIASWFRPEWQTSAGKTFPTLHTGIIRCRWGGENAYGMIERAMIR